MAEIMTNFRAEDMLGVGKAAAPAAPKKVAPAKKVEVSKPEPVVEVEPVVEAVAVAEEKEEELVATVEVEEAE